MYPARSCIGQNSRIWHVCLKLAEQYANFKDSSMQWSRLCSGNVKSVTVWWCAKISPNFQPLLPHKVQLNPKPRAPPFWWLPEAPLPPPRPPQFSSSRLLIRRWQPWHPQFKVSSSFSRQSSSWRTSDLRCTRLEGLSDPGRQDFLVNRTHPANRNRKIWRYQEFFRIRLNARKWKAQRQGRWLGKLCLQVNPRWRSQWIVID